MSEFPRAASADRLARRLCYIVSLCDFAPFRDVVTTAISGNGRDQQGPRGGSHGPLAGDAADGSSTAHRVDASEDLRISRRQRSRRCAGIAPAPLRA